MLWPLLLTEFVICSEKRNPQEAVAVYLGGFYVSASWMTVNVTGVQLMGYFMCLARLSDSLTHASNTFTLAPAARANTSSSDLNGFSPQHLGINLCFFHVVPADAPWREGSEEARFGEVIMAVTEQSLNGLSVTNAPERYSANIVLPWTIFLWSHKSVVSDPPPGTNRSDTIYGLF